MEAAHNISEITKGASLYLYDWTMVDHFLSYYITSERNAILYHAWEPLSVDTGTFYLASAQFLAERPHVVFASVQPWYVQDSVYLVKFK
ncbi:MAG: hypothetical protein ACK4IY_08520, partial [Chitinophagales bacterium]